MSWLHNILNATRKGVIDTGHFLGKAQNNRWVKGLEAAGLAASGIGIPEAALLMGGAGLVGGAIRPGGGLKGALTQGGQGALIGAGAGIAGHLGGFAHGSATPPPAPTGINLSGLPAPPTFSVPTSLQTLGGNVPTGGIGSQLASNGFGSSSLVSGSRIGHILSGLGDYAKSHPELIAGGAGGLLNAREQGQQLEFQKHQADQQNSIAQQQVDMQKAAQDEEKARKRNMSNTLSMLFAGGAFGPRPGGTWRPGSLGEAGGAWDDPSGGPNFDQSTVSGGVGWRSRALY